jgi:hypothetical protein
MDADTICKVAKNLRNPIDSKNKVQITSRSILLLRTLFVTKQIDVIELHTILLRLAYTCNALEDSTRYITLRDILVYMCTCTPSCLSLDDIRNAISQFNTSNDGEYSEVQDMKVIASQIL